jgi:hypothetical protein
VSAARPAPQVPGGPARLISCILPDDGTERQLLAWLRDEAGVTRANSVYCRGISVLREAHTRRGKLPEPSLARLVTVIAEAEEADALFERIYDQAGMHRPGGGVLTMTVLPFATPFELPGDLPREPGVNPR